MNFLEIAKRVRQECGISGDGPSNVSGQVGMYAKIIGWVQAAHEELQQLHSEWNFDWAMAENPLRPGRSSMAWRMTGAWTSRRRDGGLYVYRTADGPAAKTWVPIVDWAMLRALLHTEHHWNADLCGDDA